MDVDLRLLRYFVAVGEELNFSRAAERLHIAQPSLSRQIRQLERRLGLSLFIRTSRQVELTEAGEVLLPQARELVARWTEMLGTTREAATRESLVLRVGFVSSAANELTPLILRRFSERRPGWRVQMSQTEWQDPTAGLAEQAVDVALLRVPIPDDEPFSQRTLLEEPRWIALPGDHPLAAKQVIELRDVLDEPFVATPEESGAWRDYWLGVPERGGHPVRIGAVVRSSDEWLEAIVNGHGVSFTAQATARFYQRPGITYRPVEGLSSSEVAVVWPRDRATPAVRDFVWACLEVARQATPAGEAEPLSA
jgi:DNA-binding transcriptional LysR family regulator